MKKYQHIFFDLDHTLWDFDKNTVETIREIYDIYDFSKWDFFTFHEFMEVFREVNNHLWDKYNHGFIDQMELRNSRFGIILKKLGVAAENIPQGIGKKYLELSPIKPNVLPFTHDMLAYLKPKYRLHILSNGFVDVQHTKLKASKIHEYFEVIITSDSSGFRKPQKEIFEFAMSQAGATIDNALMIGDNLDTDIIGAQNASMDHVFFNPNKVKHQLTLMHEIHSLKEIMHIL